MRVMEGLLYHSTLGLRATKKKKKKRRRRLGLGHLGRDVGRPNVVERLRDLLQNSGFRVQGSGFRGQGSGVRVQGSVVGGPGAHVGLRVQGRVGFRIQDARQ